MTSRLPDGQPGSVMKARRGAAGTWGGSRAVSRGLVKVTVNGAEVEVDDRRRAGPRRARRREGGHHRRGCGTYSRVQDVIGQAARTVAADRAPERLAAVPALEMQPLAAAVAAAGSLTLLGRAGASIREQEQTR